MSPSSEIKTRDAMRVSFDHAIQSFLAENDASTSALVLDSTGPSATKHYLFLDALGLNRLTDFHAVHAFSGGVFAYFGFLAAHERKLAKPIGSYFKGFDSDFRRCHHKSSLSSLAALGRLLRYRSAGFGRQALAELIELIFAPDFLSRPLAHFPRNLVPYIARKGVRDPLDARQVMGSNAPVRDVLLAATHVPFFYGDDPCTPYFDAAFAPGYKAKLKSITSNETPCLVSTPWRSGVRGRNSYINCFGAKDSKKAMLFDFARLLLNLPNRSYELDLQAAFSQLAE